MPTNEQNPSLSYRDAGVDIDAGAELVERIKPHARRTLRPEVMGGLGGFGSLFELPPGRYRHPVLVAGTDGVGTKLKLALATGRHDTIGIDLVGMCVNDIVVQGAEPLFFLDYYATGKLDVEVAASVIKGIADGCAQAGCALVGGETAEMPGMYDVGDYDLAGFAVGVVEKDAILDGSKVAVGDVVLGLASSGPHSNGYSLIRRILELHQTPLDARLPSGRPLMDALMAPTQIYVKPLLGLLADLPVHALAHITGGGITENLPRVLPADTQARIDAQAWTRPEVFEWIERQGNVDAGEMLRTFNCGIGMALVLPADAVDAVSARLRADDIEHWIIGRIEPGSGAPKVVYGA